MLILMSLLMVNVQAEWVPEHPLLSDSSYTVNFYGDSLGLRKLTGDLSITVSVGRLARSVGDVRSLSVRVQNTKGSVYEVPLGSTGEHRSIGGSDTLWIDSEGRDITFEIAWAQRYRGGEVKSMPRAQALKTAEGFVRAFVARQVSLNSKSGTTLTCGNGTVAGHKLSTLNRKLGRSTEIATKLGFAHHFDAEESTVSFVKGSHTVKVFLGSRKAKVDGQMRDLGCSTMEEGGKIFVDQDLIQILVGLS